MSNKFYSNVYGRLNYNQSNRTIAISNKYSSLNPFDTFDVSQPEYSYRTWYKEQMGLNENNLYQDAYKTQLDTPVETDTPYFSYDRMPPQFGAPPGFCKTRSIEITQTQVPESSTYKMSTNMRIGNILMNSKKVPKVTTFY
jgi:hypothetical protein